ncbi:MAG: hypothetical protein FWB72_05120 [Firmicutes bacterium]|nr:hypothetical protein [Bacillota bacterium]
MCIKKEWPKLALGCVAFIGAVFAFVAFARALFITEEYLLIISNGYWEGGDIPTGILFTASNFLAAGLFLLGLAAANILSALDLGKWGAIALIAAAATAAVFAILFLVNAIFTTREILESVNGAIGVPVAERTGQWAGWEDEYVASVRHEIWVERLMAIGYVFAFGLVPMIIGIKKFVREA